MSVTAQLLRSRTSGPAGVSHRCPGSSRPTVTRGDVGIAGEGSTASDVAVLPEAIDPELLFPDDAVAGEYSVDDEQDPNEVTDADLLAEVRAGDDGAYAELYGRHADAAYNLARQLTRSTHDANDFVHEAFYRVLKALQNGAGPRTAFRAYLLTTLRHAAYDMTRRGKKLEITDDVSSASGVHMESISVTFPDTIVELLEKCLATQAFGRLPERWQAVLWFTEIRMWSPSAAAPILGLTPNGVSALAYRAREGLRQAYLQAQLDEPTGKDCCRSTNRRLGAWCRNGLSKRETARVDDHLAECGQCRARTKELAEVNPGLVTRCA